MKPNRLLLGLLFAGALLGSGMAPSTVNANSAASISTAKQRDSAEQVTLTKSDVTFRRGAISGLASEAVAQKLVDGAALIIPSGLASRIDDIAFEKTRLENLAEKKGPGISSLDAPGIKEIGKDAFKSNQIFSVNLPLVEKIDTNAFLYSKLQSLVLPKAVSIGKSAFQSNLLVDVLLPKAKEIKDNAFYGNQLKSVDLPEVETVGEFAFAQNQLTSLKLPKAKTLVRLSFYHNLLTSVSLPDGVTSHDAFLNQFEGTDPHASEVVNSDPLTFQEVLDSQKLSFTVGGVEQSVPRNVTIEGTKVAIDNEQKTITNPNHENQFDLDIRASDVGYGILAQITLTKKPPVTPPSTNPGGSTGSGAIGSSGSSNNTNQNPPTPPETAPSPTEPITPEKPTPEAPNYAEKKGAAVYAIRGIYLYKSPNFTKSQRIAKYPKQKRINRPMFVITDYARSRGGALRFKVRDVNHTRKSAGKVGYITANQRYVVPAYYQSVPKGKKITVISKKGIHAYKNETLTGRQKSYRKGTRLTVKKLVKHNLTTRYQLSNGYYVSGNKKLVIQGTY